MIPSFDETRDLHISRIIKAPRAAVWAAWADPASLAQWWLPAPSRCEVVALELEPGGGFVTRMSEAGGPFVAHIDGCFLDVVPEERIVFTETMTRGWRPSGGFITAVIGFADHPAGTEYSSHVMHRSSADRDKHLELGFEEGWGTVIDQLAGFIEPRLH